MTINWMEWHLITVFHILPSNTKSSMLFMSRSLWDQWLVPHEVVPLPVSQRRQTQARSILTKVTPRGFQGPIQERTWLRKGKMKNLWVDFPDCTFYYWIIYCLDPLDPAFVPQKKKTAPVSTKIRCLCHAPRVVKTWHLFRTFGKIIDCHAIAQVCRMKSVHDSKKKTEPPIDISKGSKYPKKTNLLKFVSDEPSLFQVEIPWGWCFSDRVFPQASQKKMTWVTGHFFPRSSVWSSDQDMGSKWSLMMLSHSGCPRRNMARF